MTIATKAAAHNKRGSHSLLHRLPFVAVVVVVVVVAVVVSTASSAFRLTPTTTTTATTTKKRLVTASSSLTTPPPFGRSSRALLSAATTSSPPLSPRGGGGGLGGTYKNDEAQQLLKESKAQANALFGNIRVPAALFAGASAVAAFAMPIVDAERGLKLGFVKRLYALLMMSALSSQIVAVVVSTLSLSSLALMRDDAAAETTANEKKNLLETDRYEFNWAASRFHFLNGVLCFVVGIGLRAWVTVKCPIIARAALGIILSGAALCVAFIQEMEDSMSSDNSSDGIILLRLPVRYARLFWKKARKQPAGLFAAAWMLSTASALYVAYNVPHIVEYLLRQQ